MSSLLTRIGARPNRSMSRGKRRIDRLSLLIVATSAVVLCGGGNAWSGPCTAEISQLEQQISQSEAAPPPSGAGTPSAPQTLGAQLHHQPTPGTVAGAEHTANADGDAALARARKADAAGDAQGCDAALREARRLYGISQ
jgi:hypothetical protein